MTLIPRRQAKAKPERIHSIADVAVIQMSTSTRMAVGSVLPLLSLPFSLFKWTCSHHSPCVSPIQIIAHITATTNTRTPVHPIPRPRATEVLAETYNENMTMIPTKRRRNNTVVASVERETGRILMTEVCRK